MKYIVGSGWWCSGTEQDDRAEMLGSSIIREKGFHQLWYQSLVSNANPEKIIIVDSNSPVKPILASSDERLEFISLNINAGHSTNHQGKFSGYSRAIFVCLEYALQCDCDYFVYVEQDALLQGSGIIEHCIEQMNTPYMFGSGDGTGGILQQSFFIIKTTAIAEFLQRLKSISYSDNEMSPEDKFHIAACKYGGSILAKFRKNAKANKFCNFVDWQVYKYLRNWQALPIGHGRERPIDFSKPYLYFQHGSVPELKAYMESQQVDLFDVE